MKTAILCGGKGTRLKELTESIPKPLVEVGGRPVLWHIMKLYSHFGFSDFILCLGYKGEMIEEYFNEHPEPGWDITFAYTGLETPTGGRINKIKRYIKEETFFANYGDGLAKIDLNRLLRFHKSHGKTATITTVKPFSQFGIVKIDSKNRITSFVEKPLLTEWINGGFFVFNSEVFDYLKNDSVLEREPFERLASEKKIYAFKLNEYWKCMDTYKDRQVLHDLWESGKAPWHVWR